MLIESISAPDDYTTRHGLKANVTFREVFVATVKTIAFSAAPQVTDSSSRGELQPVEANKSILNQILGMVKGG